MALGAGGSGGCWGFLGQAPAWGWCCPRRGGRNGTARTQQCRMQTELQEGDNKRLGFSSSSSPAGAPQRRRCMAARSWEASSLSSQPRHPLPALTGVRVGEPSHDKPSQAINSEKPFIPARLGDPTRHPAAQHLPRPLCSMCWSNKGGGWQNSWGRGHAGGHQQSCTLKQYPFLLFPLWGCSQHLCSQRG